MPWLKTGATHYRAQQELSHIGRAIKEYGITKLVVVKKNVFISKI